MGALQPLATRWEGRLGGSALLQPLSIRADGVCSARVTSSVRATELRGQREVGVLWGSCIGSGDRHNGSVGLIKLAACKTLGKASHGQAQLTQPTALRLAARLHPSRLKLISTIAAAAHTSKSQRKTPPQRVQASALLATAVAVAR